jgi:CheY-like chemotaxis protein
MGGSISVRSVKGEGSTFTVLLPLRVADDTPEPEELRVAATHPSEHPYRVLVVEDVELNRSLAEAVLEEGGFLYESVVDGREAVRAVDEHPLWYYDLVLMDIQMPVMDGYAATRAIRALPRADVGSLPIVALSANAREEDRRMSLESGMDDHVAKPFDFDGLLNTISEHIARRGEQQG